MDTHFRLLMKALRCVDVPSRRPRTAETTGHAENGVGVRSVTQTNVYEVNVYQTFG